MSRLRDSLPPLQALGGLGIEAQARAVLGFVLDSAGTEISPVTADPSACPNCGRHASFARSPYCGEACREAAGFVRQFRSGLEQGWIFDDQKQVALGQNLWHILGGGRPLRREIAPARAREAALKRQGGVCQECGGLATTVDHVGSGCNRPINLRAVCESCCLDRPFGERAVLDRPACAETISDLSARIAASIPVRCCDDAQSWDWRAHLEMRKGQPPKG
jgi:hypothetical protein